MKFKITWPDATQEEVCQESASSVEEFVNIQFGSAWTDAEARGVTVEEVVDQEPELPL